MEIICFEFFVDNSLLFQKRECFIHKSMIKFSNSVNERKYINLLCDKDSFFQNLITLLCILE